MSRDMKGRKIKRYEPPSPSYCSEDELEREDYFVDNPEYEFDDLPQPFKFLDRMLEEILDRAAEGIEKVEDLRELKRKTQPVPIYNNPTLLDCANFEQASSSLNHLQYHQEEGSQKIGFLRNVIHVAAACNTIFVAHKRKIQATSSISKLCLACVDTDSQGSIILLETLIVSLDMGDVVEAVFAFDDYGACFSFIYSNRVFIPIKIFEEHKSESFKVISWQYCNDSNMVCITKKNARNEHFIEIYKVPREQWMTDFQKILFKQQNSFKTLSDEAFGAFEEEEKEELKVRSQNGEDFDFGSDLMPKSSVSISTMHVAQMILIAIINPQKEAPCANYQSAFKLLEAGKIGNGDRHCLSASFHDSLKYQMRKELLKVGLFGDIENDLCFAESVPTLHFLKKIDSKSKKGSSFDVKHCCHDLIGVWWSFRNQFIIYKLPKSIKDGDMQQEYVYPNAESIVRSCVNLETDLIALMLQNGNIVMWDRLSGEPSAIIPFQIDEPIFMEFTIISDNSQKLIIGMKSGDIKEIKSRSKHLGIKCIFDKSLVKQNEILYARMVPCHLSLLFVARNPNLVTVFDLDRGDSIFHFQLPADFSFDPRVKECFRFDAQLSMLIVSARKILQHDDDDEMNGLFIFYLHIDGDQLSANNSADSSADLISVRNDDPFESIALSCMKRINNSKKQREKRRQMRWKEFLLEVHV